MFGCAPWDEATLPARVNSFDGFARVRIDDIVQVLERAVSGRAPIEIVSSLLRV
jgi:hypothetical protein